MNSHAAAFRRVIAKAEVRALARRYFIANGFDGTLTCIGIVVGAYLSGMTDGRAVIAIGLGGAAGLGTSGIWSVYEIERAETKRKQAELEHSMLTTLEDTQLSRDLKYERTFLAIASATGPVMAMLLSLVPFLFVTDTFSMFHATVTSVGIGISLLSLAGVYLGSISKQRWYVAALRMAIAGLVVTAISLLLPG